MSQCLGNQNRRVQKILLNPVKCYLALIYPFYHCILLQELEQGITRGNQLLYEVSYVINPS